MDRTFRNGDRVRIALGDHAGRLGVIARAPLSGAGWGMIFVKIDGLRRARAISPYHLRSLVRPRSRPRSARRLLRSRW